MISLMHIPAVTALVFVANALTATALEASEAHAAKCVCIFPYSQ